MINFKLAELRKKHNLTQQELGEVLNVSYQTISKWENGTTWPDLAMLPHISAYFGVSVDALLVLVPLEETYKPSNSGTAEFWEHRLEYLVQTRKTMWNQDRSCGKILSEFRHSGPVHPLGYSGVRNQGQIFPGHQSGPSSACK